MKLNEIIDSGILTEAYSKEVRDALQSPKRAYEYAMKIGHRFPLGEPLIATDAQSSFEYATNVVKGRWKMGEDVTTKYGISWFIEKYANLITDVTERQKFLDKWKREGAIKISQVGPRKNSVKTVSYNCRKTVVNHVVTSKHNHWF